MLAEALVVIVAVVLTEPEPKPQPERSVALAFGGDVMLGRLVNATIREHGPRHVWGDTLDVVRAADATLVNLAQGETYEAIKKRMQRLSKPFGTEIRADGTRLWIDVAK